MYSLSISFGPTGLVWAFLFKEKNDAAMNAATFHDAKDPNKNPMNQRVMVSDDYGQTAEFMLGSVRAVLVEDLDQIEEARIQRSLADERCKAKFMARAKSDPVIRTAMGQGPGIVSPFPR